MGTEGKRKEFRLPSRVWTAPLTLAIFVEPKMGNYDLIHSDKTKSLRYVSWTEYLCPPPRNPVCGNPNLDVMVFGGGALGEVIRSPGWSS